MAWETRGRNSYYYRKRRVAGKVLSEYIGRGPAAEAIASMYAEERQERNTKLHALKKEKSEFEFLDSQAVQSISVIKRMVEGFLILAGYHKHKGQWRKIRNGKNQR